MATKIFEIPFNDGQDESTDRTMLEPGKLRLLQNARLTRDGRIEVRPGYTSLSRACVHTINGRFHAFDVTAYQDNLIAMGTIDSVSFTPAYPRQLLTYIGTQGWAPQIATQSDQLSPVSDLKSLYQAPYGSSMSNSDIAWTNGFLCVCTTDISNALGTIYIINVATGAIVRQHSSALTLSMRCCAVGNRLIVGIRLSTGDIELSALDTNDLDAGFQNPSVVVSGELGDTFGWDLAPLGGTSDFLMSWSDSVGSRMRLRRITPLTWATVNSLNVSSKNGDSAVIGDTTHGVVWAIVDGNDVELRTLSTALAVTTGPTDVLGPSSVSASGTGNVTNAPALGFVSSTHVTVQADNAGDLGISDSVYTTRALSGHAESVGAIAQNVRISTKLYQHERSSSLSGNFGVGTLIVGGNVLNTQQFYANCIQGVEDSYMCAARWNYGIADKLLTASNKVSRHGRCSVATDGAGTFWSVVGVLDESSVGTASAGTAQVVQFKAGVAQRKQAAEMQGALYVAGGFTYYYDRGSVAAEAGFLDTPVINAVTQGTSGSLTPLAKYTYVVVYEWQDAQGRLHRSTPSTPRAVTLTGSNDDVTLQISTPRSLRRAALITDSNGVKVVIYRTLPNDSVFFRVKDSAVLGASTYADVVSIPDTMSDADAELRPVLYTQSQKPTANVGWQPCRFLATGKDRMIRGGLPDPYVVEFTQLAFPGEPMEGASPNSFAFQARLPEHVTGVACPGDSFVVFTTAGVYEIPGEGPQRNGTGEFFSPRCIYAGGGCIDWRSILETDIGTFFQLDADKLFVLGAQGAQWIGQPVRDTLASYPVIVGSVLCSSTHRAVFACVNSGNTDGVLLIYDLRRGVWSVDRIGAMRAVAEYLGRLAYVGTDGLVYLEDADVALGAGALPSVSVRTGSFRLFSAMGQGDVIKIGLLGTYLGDCTVEGFISYDDGKTWTTMGSFAVTAANTKLGNQVSGAALSTEDPVPLAWVPKRRNVSRFALRFDVTNGTNTGGLQLHAMSLEVQAQEFTSRLPAGNQR